MRVSHQRNIVINVEIPAPGVVVQKLLPAPNNFEWLIVADAEISPDVCAPRRQRFLFGAYFGNRNLQNQVRIRRERSKHLALASRCNTWKITIEIEQIPDNLKMQMRRPIPVLRPRSDAGNLAPGAYAR